MRPLATRAPKSLFARTPAFRRPIYDRTTLFAGQTTRSDSHGFDGALLLDGPPLRDTAAAYTWSQSKIPDDSERDRQSHCDFGALVFAPSSNTRHTHPPDPYRPFPETKKSMLLRRCTESVIPSSGRIIAGRPSGILR